MRENDNINPGFEPGGREFRIEGRFRLYEGFRSLAVQQMLFEQEYLRASQRNPGKNPTRKNVLAPGAVGIYSEENHITLRKYYETKKV